MTQNTFALHNDDTHFRFFVETAYRLEEEEEDEDEEEEQEEEEEKKKKRRRKGRKRKKRKGRKIERYSQLTKRLRAASSGRLDQILRNEYTQLSSTYIITLPLVSFH